MDRRFFLLAGASSAMLAACGGGGDAGDPISLDEVAGITNNRSISELVAASPDLRTLQSALNATDLTAALDASGAFTLFAPTDNAFTALATELGVTQDQLLANTTLLTQVLRYHVLTTTVRRNNIPFNTPIASLEGDTMTISPAYAITDQRGRTSNITTTDLVASNGVVHLIDRVILPQP